MKKVVVLTTVLASILGGMVAANGAVLWSDDFESYAHAALLVAPWTGVADQQTRGLGHYEFSVRPAGMIDSSVATSKIVGSNTGGHTNGSRPIGAIYSSGTLILEGWLDSRSNAGAVNNGARLGLRVDGTANQYPDIAVKYSVGVVSLLNLGSTNNLGWYFGYGTTGDSPTYYNTNLSLYNQWQHVRLELDMVGGVGVEARLYSDDDQSTADGPWSLRVTATGLSIPQPTQVIVGGYRDYSVDEVSIGWVPEPVSLILLGLGGLGLLRRRS